MLTIYIDADACPVKESTFRVAERYSLKVFVVSNSPIFLPKADWILPVVVPAEMKERFDAVDNWIADNIQKDDIVVTNDILLAKRCVEKETRVITPRGRVLDADNIGEALAHRELMQELRHRGELNTGPAPMRKNHRSNFAGNLDTLIHAIRKANR